MSLTDDQRERIAQEIEAGNMAATLEHYPAFKQFMIVLEAGIFADWSRTKHEEADKREALYYDSRALKRIRDNLKNLQDVAKMAKQTLDLNEDNQS